MQVWKVNYLKEVSSTPDMISSFNSHTRTYLKFPLKQTIKLILKLEYDNDSDFIVLERDVMETVPVLA